MNTILKIDSSGRHAGSVTRQLTSRLTERLQSETGATLVERDVADGLTAVSESWIGSNATPKAERSPAQAETLKLSDELVAELRAADTLVFGMPVYNFSMPAALKSWVDLVCRVGETFNYTETGPKGLLTGKRAYVVVASGGVPLGAPMDFATTYLTQVLNFIGITDIKFIAAMAMATDPDAAIKAAESEIDSLHLAA